MNQRRRARVVLAALVLVSLVLITVDFRTEDGAMSRVREVATSVFGPLQASATAVTDPVVRFVAGIGDLATTFEDNQRLRERVAALEDQGRSRTDLERENAELRALVDLTEDTGWDTVPARAIAIGPSNYEWTITIDVGTDDGVSEDMAVVDGDGLVGRVILAASSTSRVLLAIDTNFSAAARIAGSGELGDVGGRGSELMLLDMVDPAAEVAPGDEVVTSAYRFGVFPAGIPLGVVEGLEQDTPDLARTVQVRPFVDFTSLDLVMVIRSTPETEPPEVPLAPDRELDPPRLVPEESPSPSDDADDGANGEDGATT